MECCYPGRLLGEPSLVFLDALFDLKTCFGSDLSTLCAWGGGAGCVSHSLFLTLWFLNSEDISDRTK